MLIYHYSRNTNEYVGASEAKRSPREIGRFLVPSHATTTPPPEVGENEIAIYSGEWIVRADYRMNPYYNKETRERKDYDIGEIPTEAYTDLVPLEYQTWNGSSWEYDMGLLRAKCNDYLKFIFDEKMRKFDESEEKAKTLLLEWFEDGKVGDKPQYWVKWRAKRDVLAGKYDQRKVWIENEGRTIQELIDFVWGE